MTAATFWGWSWTKGGEDFHFTYFEKERQKVLIGLWMIFIFYLGLFCISQVFHMDIYYFITRNNPSLSEVVLKVSLK